MDSLVQNNTLFQDTAGLFDVNNIEKASFQDMLPFGNAFHILV